MADEALMYHAATRLVADLLEDMTRECERCGDCAECYTRIDIEEGRQSVEVVEVLVMAERVNWTRFALDTIEDTPVIDDRRVREVANGPWDATRLKLVEQTLRAYLLPEALKGEAASELFVRINNLADGYARRRARSSARAHRQLR